MKILAKVFLFWVLNFQEEKKSQELYFQFCVFVLLWQAKEQRLVYVRSLAHLHRALSPGTQKVSKLTAGRGIHFLPRGSTLTLLCLYTRCLAEWISHKTHHDIKTPTQPHMIQSTMRQSNQPYGGLVTCVWHCWNK